MAYQYANQPPQTTTPLPTPTSGPFQIPTPSPTDIWRKPPAHDVFNAPIIYQSLPIRAFARARATVSGDWKTLYDQGGLVLVLPPKTPGTPRRWIKCGIEFYDGAPRMSVVAADEWADWSLLPLDPADAAAGRVAVEVERVRKEEDGVWESVLRVSLVAEGGKGRKMPIREVTWVFHGVDEGEEMWVGVFAAKPTGDEREELVVTVEEFEVERRE